MESAVRLSREMCDGGACRDAINVLSEALENAESHDEECMLLKERASAHTLAGDARKGIPDADRIISIMPTSETGYLVKAQVMTALKRYEEAESVLKMGKVRTTVSSLSREYNEELQAACAKNILRRVDSELELEPGMLGNAIRLLTEALGDGMMHRHSHKARLKRAELLVQVKRFEEAIHDLQQCLQEKPQHSPTWLTLADAYERSGRHDEAKEAYYKSISRGPRDTARTLRKEAGEISSFHQKGNAAFQEARYKEAISHYSEALQLLDGYAHNEHRTGAVSHKAELLSNRSVAHLRASMFQEAVDDAKQSIDHARQWPKAYSRLGQAFLARATHLHRMGAAAGSRGRKDLRHVIPGSDGYDIYRAEQAFAAGLACSHADDACLQGLDEVSDARAKLLQQAHEENDKAKKLLKEGALSAASSRFGSSPCHPTSSPTHPGSSPCHPTSSPTHPGSSPCHLA